MPISAASGFVITGDASHPANNPTTAASSARTRFSLRKVAATTLGGMTVSRQVQSGDALVSILTESRVQSWIL